MRITRRVIGTSLAIGGAVLAFLGAGTRQELAARAKDWSEFIKTTLALDRLDPRIVVLVVATLIGLWAWDVPQQLWQRYLRRHDLSLAAVARQKKTHAEIKAFLGRLYENTARFAIGDLFQLIDITSNALETVAPKDEVSRLAARLLQEPKRHLDNAIRPVLDARDGPMTNYLIAYGELFNRYQITVWWLHEAHKARGIKPWSVKHEDFSYEQWRRHDARFIEAMETLEHMEGCEAIIPALRIAFSVQDSRPPRPDEVGLKSDV